MNTILKLIRNILFTFIPSSYKQNILNNIYIVNKNHNDKCLHIAARFHGGFGDTLISSAWIKELYRRLDCSVKIDVFIPPGQFSALYMMPYNLRLFDFKLFDKMNNYDLKIKIIHFIDIISIVPSRILEKDKKLFDLIIKIYEFNNKYSKFIKNQSHLDGEWAELMVKHGKDRRSELDIDGYFKFNSSMGILHLDVSKYYILNKFGLQGKKYITINNGTEYHLYEKRIQIKVYPLSHYIELCKLIKQHYPDLLIVQLGGNNSLPIPNVDVNCLHKSSMSESMIILKHSLLHIDIESGLVHLRRQLHDKSIVLFGPTPMEYFKYNENINIKSPFTCTNCMWLLDDWFFKCAVYDSTYPAKCMDAITPQMVMSEFTKYMDTVLSKETKGSLIVSEKNSCEQWEYNFAIDKIKEYSKNKDNVKIADIYGSGSLLAYNLTKLGFDTTLFDINFTRDHNGDPERTEKHRLRYAESIGLKMEYGSIHNIPSEDETFDIVTCISVVEHIPEKFYAFKEMLRVLKPDGLLIVTYNLADSSSKSQIEDIRKSLYDILSDDVNIPEGLTVGGFVLRKEILIQILKST